MPVFPVMLYVSVSIATIALVVGAFLYILGRSPGSLDHSLASRLLLACGLYSIMDGLGYMPGIDPWIRGYSTSLAVALMGFFLLTAVRFVARSCSHLHEPSFAIMQGALVLAIASCLVPGLVYSPVAVERNFWFVQSVYADSVPTSFAVLVDGVLVGTVSVVFGRMLVDLRRGVPMAGYYAAAFGLLVVAALADVVSSLSWSPLPYVLAEGILLSALIFAAAFAKQITTDRTALDQLRKELEMRVEGRTRELERRTEELLRSERMAVVGRLAAGIAHELNNPAAAIKASLDDASIELARNGSTASVRACLDISLAAVERVSRIVRQFGAMAGGAETLDRARPSTSLAVAVRTAVASARDHLRPDVTVSVKVDAALWVRGVPTALEEAVTAIVLNAVEAVPDGRPGAVEISAVARGESVVLTVRDNGVGMDEAVQTKAFEPFFTTKELGRSSGIGLPVAKGLVETMGGTLEILSIDGVGTEATIRLRIGTEPEEISAKRRAAGAAPGAPAVAHGGRRLRVLLVDDDELVRVAMRRYLSKSYDVDSASSVVEALALASRAHDAILSDVVMPNGGGQRFYLELLARDPVLASRVIFITGGAFRGDLQEFLQNQSQPVMNKPVRLRELKTAIAQLVAAAAHWE